MVVVIITIIIMMRSSKRLSASAGEGCLPGILPARKA